MGLISEKRPTKYNAYTLPALDSANEAPHEPIMWRFALLIPFISTVALADECGEFNYRSYQILSRWSAPNFHGYEADNLESEVGNVLGTDGQEQSRAGDSRTVVYRECHDGFIMIVWRGDKIAALSQSGLRGNP